MESLGQLAKDLYRGRISRKPFVFSLAIFAVGIVLLSFLSTYLDKTIFAPMRTVIPRNSSRYCCTCCALWFGRCSVSVW